MSNIFLILPTQLFHKKYLDKKYHYVIWEHPHYFKKYKYNQKKILLHHGSMMYYYNMLKKYKFKTTFIPYGKDFKLNKYTMFRSADKLKLKGKPIIIDTPYFLLQQNHLDKYRKKTTKFFFHNFYTFAKKELDIIPNIKSKDKENRKRMPKNTKIPKLASNNSDKEFIEIGKKLVKSKFTKNYGNTDNFKFPLTHKTAKNFLVNFIKYKFKKFGDYQDFIDKNNNFLFHSVLSTSLNIGLLTPLDVINTIAKFKKNIPINSYEGFIRQLFWREYQEYCYLYYNFKGKNYFGNRKKLTKDWYTGELNILPVDNCIKNGFNNGYLNHIERLMVVGNFMNLSGIHPMEGMKWFIEFSCDSYEWVMYQNVLDMVFCVTGGETMKKPYISSSNYILKMSNYKKDSWSKEWDDLFRKFILSKKAKMQKFRYFFPFLNRMK